MTFSSKKLGVKRSYPGIVEADEMDYRRCLEVQMPYLGPVIGTYTDWTPREGRLGLFPEDLDTGDPWQFKNVLVR
jgi:homospermidine synthase